MNEHSDYYEEDYRPAIEPTGSARWLPDSSIEIVREPARRSAPRHVLFDFDGTLSLIREGWPEVMVPLMVEVLQATGTTESAQSLHDLAMAFVMELNGKQTIYQMMRLAEEVTARGGQAEDPVVYKNAYHDRLMRRIEHRRDALGRGETPPEEMLVPHALDFLEELERRGATLYLASGTDEQFVVEETRLLKIDRFFGPRIYGARDDYKQFSKAMVIRRILEEKRVEGHELLGLGDGYVEIQNIKAAGGTAVAVASDESGQSGKPDAWKRDRLIGAGADLVIPDFQDHRRLCEYLWSDE
ncbi:MAG TPA: HAD family hydrolase [Thermoguttaceae bacterium]|nr:HAD family hydrolase [Thermoguttaceae bacterium]